jgi:hypothetical protein
MNKYANLLTSDAFIPLNKFLLHKFKDLHTVAFLGYLIDKYKYFSKNNMITIIDNKEYFFNVHNDIEGSLYLTAHQQRNCMKILKEFNLVETKLKGIPAKTFYCINFDNIIDLFDTPIDNDKTTLTKSIDYHNEIDSLLITTTQNDLQQDVKIFDNLTSSNLTYITKEQITKEQITNIKEEELQKSKDFCPPPDKLTSKGVYEKYIKEGKFNYRGNLFFTDKEIETLKSKWNADKLEENLDSLDNWLNKPKNWLQAKNHYLTINRWINDAYKEALKGGFSYQVDLEWKANNNEKDYTDIDMSKQMLVEDF